jgi:hypothetical protein
MRTCHFSTDGVCTAMSDLACLCPDSEDTSIEALLTKVEFGMDKIVSGGATQDAIEEVSIKIVGIVLAHIQMTRKEKQK